MGLWETGATMSSQDGMNASILLALIALCNLDSLLAGYFY